MRVCWMLAVIVAALPGLSRADGPADNLPDNVRPIPPRGIAVSAADRKDLESGLERLHKDIEILR